MLGNRLNGKKDEIFKSLLAGKNRKQKQTENHWWRGKVLITENFFPLDEAFSSD